MKSPIFILFIIFNLLAVNLVSAMDIHGEEDAESHLVQMQDDTMPANDIDKSSCDHCCHISAHMTGFVTHVAEISTIETSIVPTIQNEQLYSLNLDPPTYPPRA